jgi:hypothetical protein
MGSPMDILANYDPNRLAFSNQKNRADIAQSQAVTQGVQQENQLRQQKMADMEVVRKAYANHPDDFDAVRKEVTANASGTGAMEFLNHDMTLRRNSATLKKEDLENEQTLLDRADSMASSIADIKDPQQMNAAYQQRLPELTKDAPKVPWPTTINNPDDLNVLRGGLNHHKTILEEAKERAELAEKQQQTKTGAATQAATEFKTAQEKRTQGLQDLSGVTDADSFSQWQQRNPDLARELPSVYAPAAIASKVRSIVPAEKQPEFDFQTQKNRMGLMGNSEYDQFLGQYARSLGKTPAQLSPEEGLASFQKFAELKKDPDMRAAALAQIDLANTLRRIQLGQQPTDEDATRIAQQIQNHQLAPSQLSEIRGRGNGSLGLMIERKMPKDFNWQEADSEYQLAKSPGYQQQVKNMDYAGSSMDNVIRSAEALANGKVRSINALINAGKDQVNNVNLAKFNTDRLEVADAIAKILQGGGSGSGTSDMKLKQAQDLIRSTDDPAVVRATLGEMKGLIQNRRNTLTKGTFMENTAPAATSSTGAAPPLPATLSSSDVGQTYTNKAGKRLKITAVNPQNPKQFKFDEVP